MHVVTHLFKGSRVETPKFSSHPQSNSIVKSPISSKLQNGESRSTPNNGVNFIELAILAIAVLLLLLHYGMLKPVEAVQ